MTDIHSIASNEAFRQRLMEGRGRAPVLMVYRGEHPGATADDGMEGSAIAGVERCLDDIALAIGLPIANADVFCGEGRNTLTAYFGIPGVEADLVVGYDTVRNALDLQILHRDEISVEFPSNIDLVQAKNEPDAMIDVHFVEEEKAASVRTLLRRIGVRPKAPTGADLAYSTYTLELAKA